jgi:hypothetical protein
MDESGDLQTGKIRSYRKITCFWAEEKPGRGGRVAAGLVL